MQNCAGDLLHSSQEWYLALNKLEPESREAASIEGAIQSVTLFNAIKLGTSRYPSGSKQALFKRIVEYDEKGELHPFKMMFSMMAQRSPREKSVLVGVGIGGGRDGRVVATPLHIV